MKSGCLWWVVGNIVIISIAVLFLEKIPDDLLTQAIAFLEEHELELVLLANGLLFWWWWNRKRKANQ